VTSVHTNKKQHIDTQIQTLKRTDMVEILYLYLQ